MWESVRRLVELVDADVAEPILEIISPKIALKADVKEAESVAE